MRIRIAMLAIGVLASALTIPALAVFHLMKIVEVFPGTAAAPNAQYVVIQMYAPGQDLVGGHSLTVFNAAGAAIANFTFSQDVGNGDNQDKILIATPEAQAFFGLGADLTMSPAILSAGGKVCFAGTIDCVAWGSYSGPLTDVGTPYHVVGGLTSGRAAIRRLNIAGSPTALDAGDDTSNNANDFVEGLPAPRNNSRINGTIPPSTCGNAALEALEQCDDGNTADGDGCSSTCLVTPLPPQLSIGDVVIAEGNNGTQVANFTVNLAPISAGPVSFDIAADYGTAAPGSDFVAQRLLGQSIAAGQSGTNFAVTINGDTEVEANETFTVSLDNVAGAVVLDGQARGTIVNDDSAVLSIADASVSEGNSGTSTATFVLTLSHPMPTPVTFNVATSDASATAGSDYVARGQAARLLDAGRTRVRFEVAVNGDTSAEADETFNVTVTNLVGATLGDGSAIGTIVDDEPAAFTPIAQIQSGNVVSSLAGESVRTEGLVTALAKGGFFLQSAAAEVDGDAATSEGIFVASGDESIRIGDRVRVQGEVQEFLPDGGPDQLSLTRIMADKTSVLSHGHALPLAVALDAGNAGPDQSIAGLERYEGMRVTVPELTVVAPDIHGVDSDGARASATGRFHGVAKGVPRPFREPGISLLERAPARAGVSPVVFDGNPERLLIDSLGQRGATGLAVDVGDRVGGLVGVLGYGDGAYRLLVDADNAPRQASGATPRAVSVPSQSQATIGSLDLRDSGLGRAANGAGTQAGSAHARRMAKNANAICAYARRPDLLVVLGVDDHRVIEELAAAVNANDGNLLFPGSCQGSNAYRAYAAPGGGIGFLASTAAARDGVPRVQVLSVARAGQDARFARRDGSSEPLHERPPLIVQARINDRRGSGLPLTLVINRLTDVDGDPAAAATYGWARRSDYLRSKRSAQAAFLARLVQARQVSARTEKLVVLGDFNASEFNDGYTDVLGVITGRPAAANRVLERLASPVRPPLTNLTTQLPASERYTVTRDGNAQALSHVLVNAALLEASPGLHLELARINADFGRDNFDDPGVPMGTASSDPQVLFLELE